MKKMIVTANIEFSMENNSGEKNVIKSAANLEVSANNCAAYPQKIDNAAFDCLRMAMQADNTTDAIHSSLNKMIIEENESSNDKVDRGDAPIEPILVEERKNKTVNTFAGTAKVKKVKKPMIHLLTTEDAPHGEFSKKLLCVSSITEDNISILKDIKEARHIDAKRFKHLVSIDSSFFSNLGINSMSLKNKIFKTQSDLLVHLCKPKSEVFVSLDAIEILKANSGARRPFNTSENLLTYEEIVNKYLGLEHEVNNVEINNFASNTSIKQNETLDLLEKINSKVLTLMKYVELTKNADLDETIKKGLCDLGNKALFVIADEFMNLSINKKIADLSKLLKLEKEIDDIIEYFNKPVFYLDFQEHNSELEKQLSDTNKNKWSFKLKLIKTTLLGAKSADFPTNVLIHEDTKLNVINHIANSKHMHYLVDCPDILRIAEISEFKLFMKQRDIDMFREMIKISKLKENNEAIKNASTRLDNVDIKVDETLSKLTGGNEEEQIPFGSTLGKFKMAKVGAENELKHLNALMTQVDRPGFKGYYVIPNIDTNKLVAESNERELNLLNPKNRFQFDLKNALKDLSYTTRNLLDMSAGISDAESILQEDLNILINRANFITDREILNLQQNEETASIEKIKSLISELDKMIAFLDKEVIYLSIPDPRSVLNEVLGDTNREEWYFDLRAYKTRYSRVKGTEYPKNVLLSKETKDAIFSHIENSKYMHYSTMFLGMGDFPDTETITNLTKDFDIYMKQDDIDAFMKMINLCQIRFREKVLKDANARNKEEALGFYGSFAKAFKEATSKDTLLSKIVNNPRWNNMEKSAGVKSNIMKIDRRNTVDLCNAEIEFLTNVNIECINIEFPSFKRVPENKINKLLGIISLNNEKLNHHEKCQIASAVLENGLYMSSKDLELLLDKGQCESCSKKHTEDSDTATRTALEIKDYSLDALKKLTQSLKRFPESTHFIILGVNEDTNELLINDGLYGIPRDLNLYRVCKKRASLFQYLDLGDIVLEDLLNTKIYLTESFVATVCNKLKIDVKTFQKKIFHYGTYRYPVEQIIKRHDFDGDRINSYELKEPLQNPTLDEYAPGLKDKVKELIGDVPKKALLNLTYPIPSVIREYKKSEASFIETVKRFDDERNHREIDEYGLYYYKRSSISGTTNDIYVFMRKSTAADIFKVQSHPLFIRDTNGITIVQIPHTLFKREETVFVPNNVVQILNQNGVVFLTKDVNDRGRAPKISLQKLNEKPNFKVKDIKVVAENAVSSAGEPIDLEMIITLESNKKMKAVELRAETKKEENMNLWINPLVNLGVAGLELEIDMIITPYITKNNKSLILSPYATYDEDSYGEVRKINKTQSTHSEFIDIPRLILESKCQIFISAYAIVAIQEQFDLKRSEVNNFIFDFGYVTPGEVNAVSEKIEIKRENVKPDIQLRTLTACEVKALPAEIKNMLFNINSFSEHEEMTIKDFDQYATNHAGLCRVSFSDYPDLYIVISREAHGRIPIAYRKFITKVDSLKAFELDAEGVRQISYHLERNQLPKIVAVQVVSNMLRMKQMDIDSNKLNPDFLDFFRTICKHAENVKAVALTDTNYITENIVLYESKLAKDLYIALDINVYKALPKNLKRHLQYKTNCFGIDTDITQKAKEAYASGKAATPVALEIFATLN